MATRAFWAFAKHLQVGDQHLPDLPALPLDSVVTTPCEIHAFVGGAAYVHGAHDHWRIGNITMPNSDLIDAEGDYHHHWFAHVPGGSGYQGTVGAAHHSHGKASYPAWYLTFVVTDDAGYAACDASGNVLILIEANVDGEGNIDPVEHVAWSGPERTTWVNNFKFLTGYELPDEVTGGARFAWWLLATALARGDQDEYYYRYQAEV